MSASTVKNDTLKRRRNTPEKGLLQESGGETHLKKKRYRPLFRGFYLLNQKSIYIYHSYELILALLSSVSFLLGPCTISSRKFTKPRSRLLTALKRKVENVAEWTLKGFPSALPNKQTGGASAHDSG